MKMDEIKRLFVEHYSHWNVYFDQSGIATWVSMNDVNSHFFEIKVTPYEGVRVSIRRNVEEIDFGGHDEVFESLDEALNYVDRVVAE